MIYDKITNYELYAGISSDIRKGLEFLNNVSPDIEKGVHIISPRVKAIVSEYMTKLVNEYGYEAHKKYIDIHYLISGEEIVCSLPLEYLKETTPYNEDKDAAFLEETNVRPQEVILGNGYFAIYFPQDGHKPQLVLNEQRVVKKVVVKVQIDE